MFVKQYNVYLTSLQTNSMDMKKVLILSVLNIAFSGYIAQNNQRDEIIGLIEKNNLSREYEDKMILISCWSVKNLASREKNKEAQRVYKIYEQSKLVGGSNGVYFVSLCTDCNALNYNITISRDSILPQNAFFLKGADLASFTQTFGSDVASDIFLFDKDWNLVKKVIRKEDIFPLMLNQITR